MAAEAEANAAAPVQPSVPPVMPAAGAAPTAQVPVAAAAASTVPSAAKPATVTFAAIKQLREQCPFADMKLCKEALRDHGCDIALAAAALEGNRV